MHCSTTRTHNTDKFPPPHSFKASSLDDGHSVCATISTFSLSACLVSYGATGELLLVKENCSVMLSNLLPTSWVCSFVEYRDPVVLPPRSSCYTQRFVDCKECALQLCGSGVRESGWHVSTQGAHRIPPLPLPPPDLPPHQERLGMM